MFRHPLLEKYLLYSFESNMMIIIFGCPVSHSASHERQNESSFYILNKFFLLFSFSEIVSYFFSFSVCKFMVKRCGLEYLIDFELFLFGGENKIKEYF